MTTVFPMIAAAWPADRDRVRRLSRLVTEYLVMVSLPVLGFTIVASEPLVLLLFGEQFVDAARALPILMGAFVVICFGYLAGHLVIVLELQRLFLVSAAIALAFNVVANLILIPPYGFVAAAWVTLATEVLVTVLTLAPAVRRIELELRPGRSLRALAAAAAMALAVLGLREAGAPLGVLVAAAALTYPAGLALSGALRPQDVRDLLALRERGEPPS
jgi:O-antigen/teichoic acid export membrane protein